ncbi:MAG: hypothetical protein RSD04_03525 [Clostridia bacterium]
MSGFLFSCGNIVFDIKEQFIDIKKLIMRKSESALQSNEVTLCVVYCGWLSDFILRKSPPTI